MIFMLRSGWIGFAPPHLPPAMQVADIDLHKTHDVQVIVTYIDAQKKSLSLDLKIRKNSES